MGGGAGKMGVVMELGSTLQVRLYSGQVVMVQARFLEPTLPQKKDRVKVLAGEWKNLIGTVASLNNQEAVVSLDSGIQMIGINLLGKYVA